MQKGFSKLLLLLNSKPASQIFFVPPRTSNWVFQNKQFEPVSTSLMERKTLDKLILIYGNVFWSTRYGAVVISYTFYFMRSTFKCYTISSNQTFKSYTISISYQFNFQMLYIPFLLLNLHKLYLNMKSSFKSPKLEKRLIGFHYKNLLQLT